MPDGSDVFLQILDVIITQASGRKQTELSATSRRLKGLRLLKAIGFDRWHGYGLAVGSHGHERVKRSVRFPLRARTRVFRLHADLHLHRGAESPVDPAGKRNYFRLQDG